MNKTKLEIDSQIREQTDGCQRGGRQRGGQNRGKGLKGTNSSYKKTKLERGNIQHKEYSQ